jgi:hypothetical protein
VTILNVTVTPAFALVSTDTAVADRRGAVVAFASKILALPHLHMIVAGTGSYAVQLAWRHHLATNVQAEDVEEVSAMAPAILRAIAARLGVADETWILHLGLAKADGALRGFLHQSGAGFEGRPLDAGQGHTLAPTPATDQPDYDDLAGRWTSAALGTGTEDFHRAVAWNQFCLCARGEGRPGAVIGGQLHIARVDRAGIAVRVAADFPGRAAQLAALRQRNADYVDGFLLALL